MQEYNYDGGKIYFDPFAFINIHNLPGKPHN